VTHLTESLKTGEERKFMLLLMKILLPVFACEILLLQIISNQFSSLSLGNLKTDLVTTPRQLWVWLLNHHWSYVWIHT